MWCRMNVFVCFGFFLLIFSEIANFNSSRDTIKVEEKKTTCRKRRKEIFFFRFSISIAKVFGHHMNLFANSRLKMTRRFHHQSQAVFSVYCVQDSSRTGNVYIEWGSRRCTSNRLALRVDFSSE